MPRNLVVCLDGTDNEFSVHNTNVVRLFQALDRGRADQLAYYDPGVGTIWEPGTLSKASQKLQMILGLAFGLGVTRNVSEAYAFLLQYLTLEPEWLAQHLGMPEDEVAGFVDFAAFNKLFLIRRQTAKLLYELRLYRDPDPAVARASYGGMLGLLTGVQVPEANWLTDVDDNLYAARYLRAWMLESTIAARLRSDHGAAWWNEAAAGDRLRGLWAQGQRPSAEDVLAQLGYDRLDWRPILHHIRVRLIGELSGYGGPNITTRAGTRKV